MRCFLAAHQHHALNRLLIVLCLLSAVVESAEELVCAPLQRLYFMAEVGGIDLEGASIFLGVLDNAQAIPALVFRAVLLLKQVLKCHNLAQDLLPHLFGREITLLSLKIYKIC